ncbi:MAG: META domain-containing protein [Anaerolineales bacterium]|jgi:heat shock protein HslJ
MWRNGLLGLCAVFLAACGASQLTLEDLGKAEWKLVSLDDRAPIAEARVTLNIYEDNINGTTGCNAYQAGYTLKGEKISISDMVVTKQYCETPPGIMEQEKVYMEILKNAVKILVENDQLILSTEDEHFLLFGESFEIGDDV